MEMMDSIELIRAVRSFGQELINSGYEELGKTLVDASFSGSTGNELMFSIRHALHQVEKAPDFPEKQVQRRNELTSQVASMIGA